MLYNKKQDLSKFPAYLEKKVSRSDFVHDLITLDFSAINVYSGLRMATLVIVVIVFGVITNYAAEASVAMLGTASVLIAEMVYDPSRGSRTRTFLIASLLYASIFAAAILISMTGLLVTLLIGLGLFIISYFKVMSTKVFMILYFAGIVFVIGVATTDASIELAGQMFILVLAGGVWGTLGTWIFPSRRSTKYKKTATIISVQQQQPKLSWRERFKPLRSNLSLHSQYFQFALALALTGAFGLLIAQVFELSEGDWILITIVVLLLPNVGLSNISFTLGKTIHRMIGTIIGAIIAIMIIDNVQNIWLLSLFLFIFTSIYLSIMNMKNYAFTVIFMTVMVLLLVDIPDPTADPTASLERIQNVFIGCALSLLTAFIIWTCSHWKRSSSPLGQKHE
jgi:MFS family permease